MPPPSPNRRRRARGGDDLALWRRVTRDIAPLWAKDRGRAPAGESPAVQAAAPAKPPPVAAPAISPPARPEPPLDSLDGIDRANAERLKRGRQPVAATL